MRLRSFLLSVVAVVAMAGLAPSPAHAVATPTEAAAMAAANSDHTAYTLPPDKLAKSVGISRFYDSLYFIRTVWGMVVLFLILQLGIAARMRAIAVNWSANRWAQGSAFMFQFLLLITLLGLPLRMIGHQASVRYGFSVQHWPSWFGDQAKDFMLLFGLGTMSAMLVFLLMRRFPRRWWLWLWPPTVFFGLLGTFLQPLLIDPLYSKFEPLGKANPALAEQIEKVASHGKIDLPRERMFLMIASAKTTGLNAYVTGFGSSKRLVVWDTLLAKATPDEISLIAGHEMGHYVLGHVVRGVLISFVGILLAYFVGFHIFQFLLSRFGTRWKIPSQENWAAIVVMYLAVVLISFFAEPIGNSISRSMEHDADVFGQEVVHGIVADPQTAGQASFQLLGESQFVNPSPSALVEFWTGSHPPIWLRAAFAKHYDPWAPGEEPKYFKK